MSKAARRARKKERKAIGLVDGIKPDVLAAYIATRVVCDRCGQEQHNMSLDDYTPGHLKNDDDVSVCVTCGWDTGTFLDSYGEMK